MGLVYFVGELMFSQGYMDVYVGGDGGGHSLRCLFFVVVLWDKIQDYFVMI